MLRYLQHHALRKSRGRFQPPPISAFDFENDEADEADELDNPTEPLGPETPTGHMEGPSGESPMGAPSVVSPGFTPGASPVVPLVPPGTPGVIQGPTSEPQESEYSPIEGAHSTVATDVTSSEYTSEVSPVSFFSVSPFHCFQIFPWPYHCQGATH